MVKEEGGVPIPIRFKRYGVVGVAFFHLAVSRGIHGVFGVFYVALLEAFGWSRAATAGAISLQVIIEGLCFPFVGYLTDHFRPRRALILGGFVLALGLGLSATVSSLWQLYLWLGLVTALGLTLIGQVPHVAILSREFPEHRGTVLGLAQAGAGIGILLLMPLSQIMIDAWGWRIAFAGLAGLTALLVIPSALIHTAPASRRSVAPAVWAEKETYWTVSRALRTSVFWLLFGSRVLGHMGNNILVMHQMAHATDVGYSKLFAASILGLLGFFSFIGRLLFGYLADRVRKEFVFTWVQTVSILGIVALLALRDSSHPELLYAYAFLYGLGQGSRVVVFSAISADLFLGSSFGAIYGYFTLSQSIGGAFGAWLGGFLHDVTGSYFIAFLISILSFFVSTVSVWTVLGMGKTIEVK